MLQELGLDFSGSSRSRSSSSSNIRRLSNFNLDISTPNIRRLSNFNLNGSGGPDSIIHNVRRLSNINVNAISTFLGTGTSNYQGRYVERTATGWKVRLIHIDI
jgi:hypothetical protein